MKNTRWKIAQFFEINWWKNYLKNKDTAQYLEWKTSYWKDFLATIDFKFIKNQSVLDVGCGPAGVYVLSKENNTTTWTAVDPLLKDYNTLAIFNKQIYKQVKFENVNFENFESSNKFDVIFCLNALNHFKNIEENLEKLNNLMTEESELILSLDTHNYRLLKWILYVLPLDILHPHQYTELEYEKMFLNQGFKIVKKKKMKRELIFSYQVYTLSK